MVYPLHWLAALPVTASRTFESWFTSRRTLQTQNTTLRHDNLQLQAQLQKYASLQAENQRLRQLLDSSTQIMGGRLLVASLSAIDLDPYRQHVMIDKGEIDGAFVGQAVLSAKAVMGQIQQVSRYAATVLLITDANHAMPVQVLRNGLHTIAVGTGRINEIQLPYLPTHADIQVGDQIVTSGLGGKFPAGYPVATVREINREPNQAFATIRAEPTAHLDRSREVLLVWDGEILAQHQP